MPLDSDEQVSLKLFTPTSTYSRLNEDRYVQKGKMNCQNHPNYQDRNLAKKRDNFCQLKRDSDIIILLCESLQLTIGIHPNIWLKKKPSTDWLSPDHWCGACEQGTIIYIKEKLFPIIFSYWLANYPRQGRRHQNLIINLKSTIYNY